GFARVVDVELAYGKQDRGADASGSAGQAAAQPKQYEDCGEAGDEREKAQGDLAVAEELGPGAKQQVVERHVGFAVPKGLDEVVPGEPRHRGADGFVEPEAASAQVAGAEPDGVSEYIAVRREHGDGVADALPHRRRRSELGRWPRRGGHGASVGWVGDGLQGGS